MSFVLLSLGLRLQPKTLRFIWWHNVWGLGSHWYSSLSLMAVYALFFMQNPEFWTLSIWSAENEIGDDRDKYKFMPISYLWGQNYCAPSTDILFPSLDISNHSWWIQQQVHMSPSCTNVYPIKKSELYNAGLVIFFLIGPFQDPWLNMSPVVAFEILHRTYM